tara:strand:- start:1148 stop:1477 length:330 start_codon:yes stop_codon:yes gene_type:complete
VTVSTEPFSLAQEPLSSLLDQLLHPKFGVAEEMYVRLKVSFERCAQFCGQILVSMRRFRGNLGVGCATWRTYVLADTVLERDECLDILHAVHDADHRKEATVVQELFGA